MSAILPCESLLAHFGGGFGASQDGVADGRLIDFGNPKYDNQPVCTHTQAERGIACCA
jgi:hypothetical protein